MPSTTKRRPHAHLKIVGMLTKFSYGTLFGIWAGMAVFFAIAYFGLTYVGDGYHAPTGLADVHIFARALDSMYFSVITATSTGYGDITPVGLSRILAGLQSISALLVFAVFVTKLVSHQQEVTLMEVHRLTFEDVFHNTREGMFIARKDFDAIIEYANKEGAVDDHHWENLEMAYRQLQTLFEEIPDFYANEIHHYTIDEKREKLLLESAHRTLHRINQTLDALSSKGIDWVSHETSMNELKELAKIVSTVTPLWKERSPYESLEAFEDIIQTKERIHSTILNSIG